MRAATSRACRPTDREKIKLYLNVDMVASPNGGYLVQGGEGSDEQTAGPGFGHDRAGPRRPADQDRGDRPEIIEFVGDDESPFIDAGIPVGGAENGDAQKKTAEQARVWGGQAGQVYDRCYHEACDRIDNVNRDVLDHYLRALAGTLAHFATSTDDCANADQYLGCAGSCTRSTPGKVMRGRVAKAATQHFKFEGAARSRRVRPTR